MYLKANVKHFSQWVKGGNVYEYYSSLANSKLELYNLRKVLLLSKTGPRKRVHGPSNQMLDFRITLINMNYLQHP